MQRASIELAAETVQRETVWDREQYIVVTLAGAPFAVPLAYVQEVEHVPAITPVPFSPPWVAGVANLRGTVLTVVDAAALLGLGAWRASAEARILVARGEEPVAVGVDGLRGMRQLPVTAMSAIDGSLPGRVATWLLGVHRGDDGLIGVLDLARLLDDADSGAAFFAAAAGIGS